MSETAIPEAPAGVSWQASYLRGTVIDRFDEIADRFADRQAIVGPDQAVSYQQLRESSIRYASALACLAEARARPLALLLPPAPSSCAAYLAVLRAGGICLPVDPGSPDIRIEAVLRMAAPAAVVARAADAARVARVGRGVPVLQVEDLEQIGMEPFTGLNLSATQPASIYLTSGSTGEPKGVLRSHLNMLHHTMVFSQDGNIGPGDRISFLYSPQSGASMPDMLGALLNGAALLPFPVTERRADQFAAWISDQEVTVLHLPVPLFRAWMDVLGPGDIYRKLRIILVGGEPVYRSDIEKGRSHVGPDCVFVHQLASTETNYMTRFIIRADTEWQGDVLPVGTPARDKEVRLLDETGREVPPGEVGEIVIGSRYLSSGYWLDPELTARKFKVDEDDESYQTYLTGDLGRFDREGRLHHMGRKDRQVRIRSHRVDVRAVEAALQTLAGVRESAVRAWSEPAGSTSLAAYVVPSGPDDGVTLDRIRENLGQWLPDYMLPSGLVILDRMPLLRSGKVDRDSLPRPGNTRPRFSTPYVAPRDALEARLAGIWEQILGIKPVGVRDPFFGLGGSSLQAIRLVASIAQEFGEELPQSSLLEAPTVEQQALLLSMERRLRPRSRAVGLQVQGSRPPLHCISPRVVNLRSYHNLAIGLGPDQPFYALYASEMPDRPQDLSRVEHEAQILMKEILDRQNDGPYFLAGYSRGGVVAFQIAHLLRDRGKQVGLVVLLDVYGPDYRKMLPFLPRGIYRPLQVIRSLQRSIDELLPWLSIHLQMLSRLGWRDKARYLTSKAASHMNWWQSRLGRRLHRDRTAGGGEAPISAPRIGLSFQAYQPRPYPGPVAVFRAHYQPLGIQQDPYMGWKDLLQGEVILRDVPGYHDSILFQPRIETLAKELRDVLSQAEALSDEAEPTAEFSE